MTYRIVTADRKFTPKEAGLVSGVSPALQRDWRRRGVLPPREDQGWSSFDLSDVIKMTVMRAFSESGLSLKAAEVMAAMAILPVLSDFCRWEDVAVFEGVELPQEVQERTRTGSVRGISPDQQFLFASLPSEEFPKGARLAKLADAEAIMGRAKSFHGVVVDLYGLAHHIARVAPLPLIRFVVMPSGEGD
jgi:hypothetical protein